MVHIRKLAGAGVFGIMVWSASALMGTAFAAPAQTGTSPTSMRESVLMAIKEHRSLRAMQENRQVVEYELKRAEKGYYPRVDLYGATGGAQTSDATTRGIGNGADSNFYPGNRAGVTLTQPIWDGYATRSKVRIAEATVESVGHRVRDTGTKLALDAVIAHIDIIRTRKILDLSQKNVERHEFLLRQVIDRQRTGADSLADVSQAKSRLARAQSQATEALRNVQAAEVNYQRLTGVSATERTMAPPDDPRFGYSAFPQVMEDALRDNPKLAAFDADTRAAVGGKELSEAAYRPNFNLEAGAHYTSSGVSGKNSDWTTDVNVMVVMRWNLFNSGADKDAVNASEARIRQSRQTLYSFQDDLMSMVKNMWESMETARKLTGFYTEAATYSSQTLNAYKEQFLLGQRSILDVLDAENELYNNSVQVVTSSYNIPVAQYNLLALGGRLLSRFDVSAEAIRTAVPTDNGAALISVKGLAGQPTQTKSVVTGTSGASVRP